MRKRGSATDWQNAIVQLSNIALGVTVIGALYWANAIFIPVALAIFLTFLLNPVVAKLQSWGIRRAPAVMVVVLSTTIMAGASGWIVTRQLVDLVQELPNFRDNIRSRVKSLREVTAGSMSGRLGTLIDDIYSEFQTAPGASGSASPKSTPDEKAPAKEPAAAKPSAATDLNRIQKPHLPDLMGTIVVGLGSVTESLASFALAFVLVIFTLIKRESLRDRLIRMIGPTRLTSTTRALDDAGQRISRFLLMQLIVNVSYGVTMAIGLFAIGLEYSLLWGFLACVLRYVPYIGAWISAVPPMLLSLAMFPGWTQPLLVFGLIVVIELITNNVVEPLLYGQSLGVSEVALLVAAAFWAFLWGPIGLVLSSPLTVCLVVLGKYVPQLEFFDILLGDEAALEPHVSLYQRLLARDQDEALQIALAEADKSSPEAVYDQVLLPVLTLAKRDRQHDELTDSDEQFILGAITEIVEDLGERQVASRAAEAEGQPVEATTPAAERVMVLACPARDDADRLALEMLGQLLDPAKWHVRFVAVETLAAELVELVVQEKPPVLCIGSLPPGGLAHTRYLCKRLRMHVPGVKIVVGRWGAKGNLEQTFAQVREAGADDVETTLHETRSHLTAWLPVLAQERKPGESSEPQREQIPA